MHLRSALNDLALTELMGVLHREMKGINEVQAQGLIRKLAWKLANIEDAARKANWRLLEIEDALKVKEAG